jgi:hypothetical protein
MCLISLIHCKHQQGSIKLKFYFNLSISQNWKPSLELSSTNLEMQHKKLWTLELFFSVIQQYLNGYRKTKTPVKLLIYVTPPPQ